MADDLKRLKAIVLGNTLSRSRNKGTPSIKLKCRVVGDDQSGKDIKPFVLYVDLWLSFKAIEKTNKALREVFGWRGTSYADFNQTDYLSGRQCIIVAELTSDGKYEVKFINSVSGMQPLQPDDLEAFLNEVNSNTPEVSFDAMDTDNMGF